MSRRPQLPEKQRCLCSKITEVLIYHFASLQQTHETFRDHHHSRDSSSTIMFLDYPDYIIPFVLSTDVPRAVNYPTCLCQPANLNAYQDTSVARLVRRATESQFAGERDARKPSNIAILGSSPQLRSVHGLENWVISFKRRAEKQRKGIKKDKGARYGFSLLRKVQGISVENCEAEARPDTTFCSGRCLRLGH